jgi:chemotaxis protein histidine kinase CheA
MTKSPAQLRRELQALRRAFLAQLPDRVQAIETTLSEALSAEEVDRQRVDALFNLAHRLCGSAGIYGYPIVHAAAGAVERVAEGLRDAGVTDEPRRVAELRQLVDALKRASEDAMARSAKAK